jgi:hypothetical protein
MTSDSGGTHETLERLLDQVHGWPGLSIDPHPEGAMLLRLGRGVLARIRPDGRLELPFPRPVAEELIAAGRAERHDALPDSGWVIARLVQASDVERVVGLLRLAYDARQPGAAGSVPAGVRASFRSDEKIDEAVDESFPASDPPARRE